jgi:hypothetical protein
LPGRAARGARQAGATGVKYRLMHSLTLQTENLDQVRAAIGATPWTVACLCAAWCGTCGTYRATFDTLAARHPDKTFIWIDVEDHADLLGELDVENFPTLLIQREDTVTFFGAVLPDPGVADRTLQALADLPVADLGRLAGSTAERRLWQQQGNLRALLAAARAG